MCLGNCVRLCTCTMASSAAENHGLRWASKQSLVVIRQHYPFALPLTAKQGFGVAKQFLFQCFTHKNYTRFPNSSTDKQGINQSEQTVASLLRVLAICAARHSVEPPKLPACKFAMTSCLMIYFTGHGDYCCMCFRACVVDALYNSENGTGQSYQRIRTGRPNSLGTFCATRNVSEQPNTSIWRVK